MARVDVQAEGSTKNVDGTKCEGIMPTMALKPLSVTLAQDSIRLSLNIKCDRCLGDSPGTYGFVA